MLQYRILNQKRIGTAWAACAVGLSLLCFVESSNAQTSLPPGVQDVVKLSRAGMSDDVILTQIRNQGAFYNLNADQIVYLKDQGVSQAVIKALISPANPGPGAAAAPAPAAPPPPPPSSPAELSSQAPAPADASSASLSSFQSQLAPYGTWVDVPGYGTCWQPSVAIADPLWRPYFDAGHWVYADTGWYWQSDYPWGGIAFHYGRWIRGGTGWLWVPGYDWAPAWVCWRKTDDYCGWAPLPPAAVFRPGIGLFFNGHAAVDVDFGLGEDAFTFVAYDRFWDHDLRVCLVPHDRVHVFFGVSVVSNGYRFDHGRFFVDGLGHDHMVAVTHHDFRFSERVSDRDRGFDRDSSRRDRRDDRRGGW